MISTATTTILSAPPPWLGVFTNKKNDPNFFFENEPLMHETIFTLGPIKKYFYLPLLY